MKLTQTHTLAILEVSDEVYEEIASKLKEAGWDHAFLDSVIDMHGVGLKAEGSWTCLCGHGMSDHDEFGCLYTSCRKTCPTVR